MDELTRDLRAQAPDLKVEHEVASIQLWLFVDSSKESFRPSQSKET